jgi:hypothetical protein
MIQRAKKLNLDRRLLLKDHKKCKQIHATLLVSPLVMFLNVDFRAGSPALLVLPVERIKEFSKKNAVF